MRKRTGFTLIELLVVIAIIAILAAILFPVFVSVRAKGMQTRCISNQRQIGMAMLQYVDDWNTKFPTIEGYVFMMGRTSPPWRPPFHPFGVFYPLQRYLKSVSVLSCPSNELYPGTQADTGGHYMPGNISYVINGEQSWSLCDEQWGGRSFAGVPSAKMAEIVSPARVVFTQDYRYKNALGNFLSYFYKDWTIPGTHTGGVVFCFADGHAGWFMTGRLPSLMNLSEGGVRLSLPEYRISVHKGYRG